MVEQHRFRSSIKDTIVGLLTFAWKGEALYQNPDLYEELVKKSFGREVVAHDLADLIGSYVPASRAITPIVLDCPAGTGIVSFELARRGYQVIAADISTEALARVQEKAANSYLVTTTFTDMNEHFPFPASTFNAVTTLSANRYIHRPDVFMGEIYRVLQEGGYFVWPHNLFDSLAWRARGADARTDRLARRLANDHGFEIVAIDKKDSKERNRKAGLPWYLVPQYIIARKPKG